MARLGAVLTLCLLVLPSSVFAWQRHRVTVVDQTGLPLPGVTIQVFDGDHLVSEFLTESDGSFELQSSGDDAVVQASLTGFESVRVLGRDADRIVLALARATETTSVVAPAAVEASPTALAGSTLTSTAVARMPSSHMHARESLPLLPSVIRGADGLIQLGGARAYQTPLTLDGFNVTDPATGLSSLNLPLEAVLSVDALRDPMAVNYGGLLGGLVRLESRAGGSMPAFGVQGFVPRLRFASPGFGRLEGIFPRAHLAGTASGGRLQYAVAGEYDYERIPVPGVTDRHGPDLVETSGIVFTRVDVALNEKSALTLEAFSFPSETRSYGLSPRRDASATVDLSSHDGFAGLVHRRLSDRLGVITVRGGVYARTSEMQPNGAGELSELAPNGWNRNWFSRGSRRAYRLSAAATLERPTRILGADHDVSMSIEAATLGLSGRVDERPIRILGSDGRLVRQITFGPAAVVRARDTIAGFAVRDVWRIGQRVQLESGVRVDSSVREATSPSARIGLRYTLDESGRTTVKAGLGTFVGIVPLAAAAFADYPVRTDTTLDPASGNVSQQFVLQPSVARLRMPQARTSVLGLEHEVMTGLDVQAAVTVRYSSRLPTLSVPLVGGDVRVESTGTGSYREAQLSVRRTWPHDQLLFLSYVRSSSVGELNEFATLFQTMDTPLVEPGGRARATNDARHRVLAWGTFNLPLRIVVSPVTEWRSGFTYTARSSQYTYAEAPNTRAFPNFLSTDLVVYKTFSARGRSADFGVQIFNLTNRWNPRDVFPVLGEPRFGEFANSVGRIFRGYMLLKW